MMQYLGSDETDTAQKKHNSLIMSYESSMDLDIGQVIFKFSLRTGQKMVWNIGKNVKNFRWSLIRLKGKIATQIYPIKI